MYTTSFPSRISFSSMDASGLLRFVAKNTNTQNSRFGSDRAPGKGNQPPPFPGGVQHLACVLHLTSSEQVTYLGLVHLCPGPGTGTGRNACLSFAKAGGIAVTLKRSRQWSLGLKLLVPEALGFCLCFLIYPLMAS